MSSGRAIDAMQFLTSRERELSKFNSHSLVLTVKMTLILDLINSSKNEDQSVPMFSSFGMAKKSTVSIIRRGSTFDSDVNFLNDSMLFEDVSNLKSID